MTHCPHHDPTKTDRTPSLSVSEKEGKTLWFCHQGCDQGVITDAIHLLFPAPESPRLNGHVAVTTKAPAKETVYDYGTAKHLRLDFPDGTKRMWWEPGVQMHTLPLWNAELLEDHRENRPDEPVLLVEGEKAADRAVACGFTAVSLPGGSSQRNFGAALEALRGLRVVLIPDLDEPGSKFMDAVAPAVSKEAVEVRRGTVAPFLSGKGADVADLLALADGEEREVRRMLRAIVDDAEPVRQTAPEVSADRWEDFNDLADEPDEEMVSYGLFSEGLWILAGAPKLGKSYFGLSYCHGLSIGGAVLGQIQVEEPCDVLALILEDGRRRYKKRLKERIENLPRPVRGRFLIRFKWPRLDDESLSKLEGEVQIRSAAGRKVVVVIDTGTKLRPLEDKSSSIYMGDYNFLDPLTEIAQRHHALIMVIAHTRKAPSIDFIDSVIGSHGISGAADGIAVLSRERHSKQATLEITGRDGDEQKHFLTWDAMSGGWLLTEQPDEATANRRSMEAVINRIKGRIAEEGRPMGSKELRIGLAIKQNTITDALALGVQWNMLTETGGGKRGDPVLYDLPVSVPGIDTE
jgi:hypothetical protein